MCNKYARAGYRVGEVTAFVEDVIGVTAAASKLKGPKTPKTSELYGRQTKSEFTGNKMKRIKKSMQQNGYDPKKPIEIAEIDGRKIIIDGHHRARAAGAAGIKEVPAKVTKVGPEKAAQYLQEAAEAAHDLGLQDRW